MALPDISGLTDDEIKQLQSKAGEEMSKRNTASIIIAAGNDLVKQAYNAGYTKTAVKTQLSKIVDEVYAASAPVA